MRIILNNGKYLRKQPPIAEFIFKINTNLGSGASYNYLPGGSTGVNYTIDYGDGTVVNYTSGGLKTYTYASHGSN